MTVNGPTVLTARCELARRLREARLRARVPQNVAGVEVGLPRTALSHIEHGRRQRIDALDLLALARLYGCSVGWLLGEDDCDDGCLQAMSRSLTADDREMVLQFARFLAARQKLR